MESNFEKWFDTVEWSTPTDLAKKSMKWATRQAQEPVERRYLEGRMEQTERIAALLVNADSLGTRSIILASEYNDLKRRLALIEMDKPKVRCLPERNETVTTSGALCTLCGAWVNDDITHTCKCPEPKEE